jgi:hypothetical protein
MEVQRLRLRVRNLLVFFVVALAVSGATAWPLKWEIDILLKLVGPGTFVEDLWPAMADWIAFVHQGLTAAHRDYPFLFYGTDWLAFAHVVIAVAFLGPLKEPVKNVWVVEWGMIACALVLPLALICGPIRGIPFFWRLMDCSFGVFGIIPLWLVRNDIHRIGELEGDMASPRQPVSA